MKLFPSLWRCAASSLLGVAVEMALLMLMVQVFHAYYLYASVAAGACYAVLNFFVNRRWAFRTRRAALWPQLARHGLVVGGGILLGTTLLWLLAGDLHLPYQAAWLMAGGLCFA